MRSLMVEMFGLEPHAHMMISASGVENLQRLAKSRLTGALTAQRVSLERRSGPRQEDRLNATALRHRGSDPPTIRRC
jgi:hypothetical protein